MKKDWDESHPKRWRVYMLRVPFWDNKQGSYGNKVRPAVLYNFIGEDAIFLPILGIENEDGTLKRVAQEDVEVPIRLRKNSVIKAAKPMTYDVSVIIKGRYGNTLNTKQQRQVRGIFKSKVLLREKQI